MSRIFFFSFSFLTAIMDARNNVVLLYYNWSSVMENIVRPSHVVFGRGTGVYNIILYTYKSLSIVNGARSYPSVYAGDVRLICIWRRCTKKREGARATVDWFSRLVASLTAYRIRTYNIAIHIYTRRTYSLRWPKKC